MATATIVSTVNNRHDYRIVLSQTILPQILASLVLLSARKIHTRQTSPKLVSSVISLFMFTFSQICHVKYLMA